MGNQYGTHERPVIQPRFRRHIGKGVLDPDVGAGPALYSNSGFLGKLLYVAVIEKHMQQRFAGAAVKLDAPRQLTRWRLCRSVAEEVDSGSKPVFQCKSSLHRLVLLV